MRKMLGVVRLAALRGARTAATAQGLGGVACVTAGVYLQWGGGWALITAGVFLLVGAWGSR